MDIRSALAGVGVVAGALLGGRAALDERAVAETRRLGAASRYVDVAQPRPAPGALSAAAGAARTQEIGRWVSARGSPRSRR